jgi:dipeptidyl aminopeptidase/acylaminoacyl peptidase
MTTKKLFSTILLLAPLASTLGAQGSSAQVLIDRELLFGNPEITGAQVSPDGEYLAFIKPWKNTRNLWVKKTEEPFSSARLLTTETKRPIGTWMWSRDGKYIAYVKDHDGDENFNVYSVDAPSSRDLTGSKGVRVQLLSTAKTDADVFYIGLNDRDKAWHDLYRLSISAGNCAWLRGWPRACDGSLRFDFRADSGKHLRGDLSPRCAAL